MMLFEAPLSGGLEAAEGAGKVLDAVVNVSATSSWLLWWMLVVIKSVIKPT